MTRDERITAIEAMLSEAAYGGTTEARAEELATDIVFRGHVAFLLAELRASLKRLSRRNTPDNKEKRNA